MRAETASILAGPREDGRYAPVTINIHSQWHHRGAYLCANVEICAADPRYTLSTASSGCISLLKLQTAVNVEDQCGASDPSLRLTAQLRMTESQLRSV